MIWLGLKGVNYSGESHDFNTPLFKSLCSISGLAIQAWMVNEFLSGQNFNGFSLTVPSFGLNKNKAKATRTDVSNKKRKNAGVLTEYNKY